jgi:hypothetical protein
MSLFFFTICSAFAVSVSPIEKIIQLLGDLEAKIIKDGEETQKLYETFTDFCKDTSKDTQFELKTSKSDAERYAASVADKEAEITALETKIGELSTTIATNSKDLAAATEIRKKEKTDYDTADAELAETVDMLRRAIAILEKEMSKTGFLQTNSMDKVKDALSALVMAEGVRGVSGADAARLAALLQDGDRDLELQPAGAPDPAAYKSKSGGIVSAMEDMLEKAEAQRADGQKAEMEANHNFKMLKQSLEDSVANQDKELADSKKAKALAEEDKAVAEGELARVQKEIAADEKKLKDLQHECMTKAEDHETEQKERSEELTALATAKKIIKEKTGGAAKRTYDFDQQSSDDADTSVVQSFLQIRTRAHTMAKTREIKDRVVSMIQGLAKETQVPALAQLALRIRSLSMLSADPFAKVKGMIQEMIEKLVKEAEEEAGHKAFCDKEMAETEAKKADKEEEVEDLNTKIDRAAAKIAKLKETIALLEEELGKIAAEQKSADETRAAEKEAWGAAKTDFEQGLEGVQMALEVLRDYYAEKDDAALMQGAQSDLGDAMSLAQKSTGAASGIIGMLEVAESDFSKMLAEGQAAEDLAQSEYEALTEDNKVLTAEKTTAVKYKNKDKKETEAFLSETKDDLGTTTEELDAVLEYYDKLKPQCIAKPEPYAERKKRREKEIAGLKEALDILEAESE